MAEGHVGNAKKAVRVCAVIVTYFPQITLLEKLLDATFPQVEGVVVVDNTPISAEQLPLPAVNKREGIKWIEKGKNVGLGAAQNVGIAWAKAKEFSHILLLDHAL